MTDFLLGLNPLAVAVPQVRAPKTADRLVVAGAGDTGGARLDTSGRGARDDAPPRKTEIGPPPDPDPPTGPPPAFQANVLEAEERKRRAGPEPLADAGARADPGDKIADAEKPAPRHRVADWPEATPPPRYDRTA